MEDGLDQNGFSTRKSLSLVDTQKLFLDAWHLSRDREYKEGWNNLLVLERDLDDRKYTNREPGVGT